MRTRKRVLVVSDFHSGHALGLTPPQFDSDTPPKQSPRLWEVRRTIWNWFDEGLSRMGKVDLLIVNGDAIDGKGEASGGTELLYPDRVDQVEMATAVIQHIDAGSVLMSYGTGYHVGKEDDWEDGVAHRVGALKIGSSDNVDVNGCVINYRHHVGGSQVPHTRYTAIAREALWNMLWAERGEYPKANIIIRSHVHYMGYCGGPNWLAMTTPSLQGYGSKYGARKMSGVVDIGYVVINVDKGGEFTWKAELLRLPMQEPVSL